MNKVIGLSVPFQQDGRTQIITPVILQDREHNVLIDCGYPGFLPLLAEAAESHFLPLESLTHAFMTHHDIDHIGALAELQERYPHIETIVYELEALYVRGKRKSIRLIQAESSLASMPEEARPYAEAFINGLKSIKPAQVHRTVADGELLPWCGGTEVVHTPGHMPGHVSLFVRECGTLIGGDAVVIEENGELGIANPQFTLDLDAALASVERLLAYPVKQLVCYHGGWFQGDARAALKSLLKRYNR